MAAAAGKGSGSRDGKSNESMALPPGVVPNAPLSLSGPTERDVASSKTLLKFLDTAAPLESREETARRETVLSRLTALVREWVRDECEKKGLPEVRCCTAALVSERRTASTSCTMSVGTPKASARALRLLPDLATSCICAAKSSKPFSISSSMSASESTVWRNSSRAAWLPLAKHS